METHEVEKPYPTIEKIMVITSCSKNKDDSIPIPIVSKVVNPSYYLNNPNLIQQLMNTRQNIFRNPQTRFGNRVTYAFDLYVNAGLAYKDLKKSGNYPRMKLMLLSNQIEWFFLSGGYGIIHALEEARKYEATFNRYGSLWRSGNVLSLICESIVSKFNPGCVYVFGSKGYTGFIKQSNFWNARVNVKMFESTGPPGPSWLSPKLNDLANAIISNNLSQFNQRYPLRFYKQ